MITSPIPYQDNDTALEGFVASQDDNTPRPVVLIVHDWTGHTEFTDKKAQALANLGYTGFAVDMYGTGKVGQNNDEKMALMQPLLNDRNLIIQRLTAAMKAAHELPYVDSQQTAIIGFCFGGLCALDLARSGANLKAAISFHGALTPLLTATSTISAKILALHGFDDPMVPPEDVLAFEQEMTTAKADWQMHVYGNTQHAFTNPLANDSNLGTVYNPTADTRSWQALENFLADIF